MCCYFIRAIFLNTHAYLAIVISAVETRWPGRLGEGISADWEVPRLISSHELPLTDLMLRERHVPEISLIDF